LKIFAAIRDGAAEPDYDFRGGRERRGMERKLEKAPASMVSGGLMNYGFFDAPVRRMNLSDARPGGPLAFRPLREARLKEWLGFVIQSPGWMFTVFLQDAKYLGSANVYAVNLETGKMFRWMRSAPGRSARLARSAYGGVSECRARGFKVEAKGALDKGIHEISVAIDGDARTPSAEMEIRVREDFAETQPLTACFPLRDEGCFIYTHKAAMPAGGRVRIGGQRIELDPERDIAIMDEHKSVFPRRTVWRWATFAFRDPEGGIAGLNIGDHETADNKSANNENCVWAGSAISFLGAARFEMDPKRRMKPWRISDESGRADVVFTPLHDKHEKFVIPGAGINYFQPAGVFNGHIETDGGRRMKVENAIGVAEMMDARF